MRFYIKQNKNGFTLIEVIITLTIVAILAATFGPNLITPMTSSTIPINRMQDMHELKGIMERITADYNSGTALATLRTNIGDTAADGGGEGTDVVEGNYGTYFVDKNRYIEFDGGRIEDAGYDIDENTSGMLKVTLSKNEISLTALYIE